MTQHRIVNQIHGAVMLACVVGIVLALIVGCRSTVTGGQQQRTDNGVLVTIAQPGGTTITYRDNTKRLATTQPSGTSASGQAMKFGAAKEGEIGSVSFEQIQQEIQNQWPVAIILLLTAAGLWVTGHKAWSVLAGLCFLLILISPVAFKLGVIGAVALVLLLNRKAMMELVRGNQNALNALSPGERLEVKTRMEAKQDEATKRVVSELKA